MKEGKRLETWSEKCGDKRREERKTNMFLIQASLIHPQIHNYTAVCLHTVCDVGEQLRFVILKYIHVWSSDADTGHFLNNIMVRHLHHGQKNTIHKDML